MDRLHEALILTHLTNLSKIPHWFWAPLDAETQYSLWLLQGTGKHWRLYPQSTLMLSQNRAQRKSHTPVLCHIRAETTLAEEKEKRRRRAGVKGLGGWVLLFCNTTEDSGWYSIGTGLYFLHKVREGSGWSELQKRGGCWINVCFPQLCWD